MRSKEEALDIDWPPGYDRTDADDREPYPGNLSVGHKQAFESIVDELGRWGKTDVQIETAATHYANDSNIPHKSADPEDPGVVAYYRDLEEHSSERSAIACDCWETQRENGRAIALWVRRIRLADRCGVETARDIDEVTQLPPAQEEELDPYRVLGVPRGAPHGIIEKAARELMAKYHPDGENPDVGMFKRVNKAREEILE